MKKISGFTLIELVMVIVILAILAVTIAPKFVDLTAEAKSAVIKDLAAKLRTAVNLALVKDQLQGGNGDPIDYNGNTVTFIAGNPQPDAGQMRYLLDLDLPSTTYTPSWSTAICQGSAYCIVGNRPFSDTSLPSITAFTSGTGVFMWPKGYTLSTCFVYYLNLADGSDAIVGHSVLGC